MAYSICSTRVYNCSLVDQHLHVHTLSTGSGVHPCRTCISLGPLSVLNEVCLTFHLAPIYRWETSTEAILYGENLYLQLIISLAYGMYTLESVIRSRSHMFWCRCDMYMYVKLGIHCIDPFRVFLSWVTPFAATSTCKCKLLSLDYIHVITWLYPSYLVRVYLFMALPCLYTYIQLQCTWICSQPTELPWWRGGSSASHVHV